jgi:hypothetical protein
MQDTERIQREFMPISAERTRCVVLLPVEGELNGRLAAAVAARHWSASTHHDPYQALVELGLRDKAQASRAAWGLQPSERAVLLLGERDLLRRGHIDCDALIDAVRRFLPRVEIFEFAAGRLLETPGGPSRDGGTDEPDRADHRSLAASHAPDRPTRAPAAPPEPPAPPDPPRLVHPPEPETVDDAPPRNGVAPRDEDVEAEREEAEASPTAVTREEIDMLLELDPGDPTP